jgi:hypothetical protein
VLTVVGFRRNHRLVSSCICNGHKGTAAARQLSRVRDTALTSPLAASLAAHAYLRALARLQGVAISFWVVLALSFEPWFWASGTHDLDYVWGTGSLIAAFYYIERRAYRFAGLACAIGFGFRPTLRAVDCPFVSFFDEGSLARHGNILRRTDISNIKCPWRALCGFW